MSDNNMQAIIRFEIRFWNKIWNKTEAKWNNVLKCNSTNEKNTVLSNGACDSRKIKRN